MAVLSLVFPHVWQLELQTLGTFNVIHSCGMAVVPLIVVWKYKYLQTLKTKALTDKLSKATTPWTGTFPLRVFHWQSQFSWVMCIPLNANGILVKSLEQISMCPKREGNRVRGQGTYFLSRIHSASSYKVSQKWSSGNWREVLIWWVFLLLGCLFCSGIMINTLHTIIY